MIDSVETVAAERERCARSLEALTICDEAADAGLRIAIDMIRGRNVPWGDSVESERARCVAICETAFLGDTVGTAWPDAIAAIVDAVPAE